MRNFLATALLVLGATACAWAQNTDAASDHVFVVGNPSQPFVPNHKATIQDAINAAQPNGTVIIPSRYLGTDCNPISNCNPGSVIVIDWRTNSNGNNVNCLGAAVVIVQSQDGQHTTCDLQFTDDLAGNIGVQSLTVVGNITAQGSISGSSVTTTGTGGILDLQFQTPPGSVPASHGYVFANSVTGLLDCLNNALTHCISSVQLLGSGTVALPTSAITSGACSSVVTLTATGATTASHIVATAAADPTGVTGYAPSASGSVYVQAYVTANTANFKVCNNTAGTITPGALTLNAVVF